MRDRRSRLCRELNLSNINDLPEYRTWVMMRQRCRDHKVKNFNRYGGRGITVSPRWDDFEVFFADMGFRPSPKHSIDRIDNDGNYEPGNCRWATSRAQNNNKASNRLVNYRGQDMSLRSAVRLAGDVIEKSAARRRLVLGWSVERAVETPPNPSFQKYTAARRQELARSAP